MSDAPETQMGTKLVALAKRRHKEELSPLEESILKHVAAGEECDCEEQEVDSDFFVWLCTDRAAHRFVHHQGIELSNAVFSKTIDLESAIIPFSLLLSDCTLKEEFDIRYAHVRGIFLYGNSFQNIRADGLRVNGPFHLRGAEVNGAVRLLNAHIGGNLSCSKSTMNAPDSGSSKGVTLHADGAQIEGGVFLLRTAMNGAVRLLGAHLNGDLDCTGSTMNAPDSGSSRGECITADRLQLEGSVFLRQDTLNGAVRLLNAHIGGSLSCTGATMTGPDCGDSKGVTLHADRTQVEGDVFLRQATVHGAVRLLSANIGGNLSCTGAQITAPDNGNSKGTSLHADRVQIEGGIFLGQSNINGAARFLGAYLAGDFDCKGATIIAPTHGSSKGDCITADKIRIKGSIFLRGKFTPQGEICLVRAVIEGGLHIYGLEHNHEWSLNLCHAKAGFLHDKVSGWPEPSMLKMNGLTYDRIDDKAPLDFKRRKKWLSLMPNDGQHRPQPYEQLAKVLKESGHETTARQICVERRQAQARNWRILPERMAQWLAGWKSNAELIELADRVERARQKARLQALRTPIKFDSDAFQKQEWNRLTKRTFTRHVKRKLLSRLLFLTIGHGYRPFRAFYLMVAIMALGCLLFGSANSNGYMMRFEASSVREYQKEKPELGKGVYTVATDPYPEFSWLWYSIDTFIPLVDLHQENFYLPDVGEGDPHGFTFLSMNTGAWLRHYLAFHIISGWVLTTLFVVGLTGLMRKSE